jgi:O-antigen ligase
MADAVNPNRIGRAFDRAALERLADWLAVAVVVTLPWSTSISQILIVAWLAALVPTLDVAAVRRELQSPAGALPVLLWILALVGMSWAGVSGSVSFAERIAGLGGFHKLLIIPLLLAQFRRSPRGRSVLYGFLASCVVLLTASVIVWLLPFHVMGRQSGVPVRDYIAQSTEFLICIFALLAVAFDRQREGRWRHAAAAALLALLFLADILLVSTGRTALAVIPLLLLMLGFRLFGWKGVALACIVGVTVTALAWTVSPFLRERINRSIVEVQLYQTTNEITSTGTRFELWKKAAGFVAAAPAIGHGTGSIPDQYRRVATGEGVTAIAANNPHNQIFAVAIQLGMLGVAILMTMWVAHLALFRGTGLISWFGLVIVTQNIVSSLFNSHLFDSFHGWLYVFGFGVVGGMALREAEHARRTRAEAQ